jgi:hypothetical protein
MKDSIHDNYRNYCYRNSLNYSDCDNNSYYNDYHNYRDYYRSHYDNWFDYNCYGQLGYYCYAQNDGPILENEEDRYNDDHNNQLIEDESRIREEEIVSLLADDVDEYQSLDEQDSGETETEEGRYNDDHNNQLIEDESRIREEEIVSLLADDADEYQSLDEQDRQLLREESTDFVIEVFRDICTQIRNGFDAWLSEQTSLSLPEFSEPSQHDNLENPIQDYWIVKRAFSFVLKDTAYDIADVAEKFISSNKIDISLVQTLESLGILEKQDLAKFCAETVFIMGSYLAPSTSKDKLKYEALLIFCLLKGVCQTLNWNLEWLDSASGKMVSRLSSFFTIITIGKLARDYYSIYSAINPKFTNSSARFQEVKSYALYESYYEDDDLKIPDLYSSLNDEKIEEDLLRPQIQTSEEISPRPEIQVESRSYFQAERIETITTTEEVFTAQEIESAPIIYIPAGEIENTSIIDTPAEENKSSKLEETKKEGFFLQVIAGLVSLVVVGLIFLVNLAIIVGAVLFVAALFVAALFISFFLLYVFISSVGSVIILILLVVGCVLISKR